MEQIYSTTKKKQETQRNKIKQGAEFKTKPKMSTSHLTIYTRLELVFVPC